MDKIWEIVLAVITSLGGIGAVFYMIVRFTSNLIADRLQKSMN